MEAMDFVEICSSIIKDLGFVSIGRSEKKRCCI